MALLIVGLVIFLGVHSVRIVADDWRTAQIAKRGPKTWKGIYSVLGGAASSWSFIMSASRAGSAAARRPSWNACVFILMATPLTSIACRIAVADSGSKPF